MAGVLRRKVAEADREIRLEGDGKTGNDAVW
jgi:hypothetical protein